MSFKNYDDRVNKFLDINEKLYEVRKLLNELTTRVNSIDYQVQNHNQNIVNNNENHEDLDKFVSIEEGTVPASCPVNEKHPFIRYFPDHNTGIILSNSDSGVERLLTVYKDTNTINMGYGHNKTDGNYYYSNINVLGKIKMKSVDGLILQNQHSTSIFEKNIVIDENGISFKQSPAVEEDGNKNDIHIANGLRFLVDDQENPTKLIIRKPGIDTSSDSNTIINDDIVLNFDAEYVTNQELNNKLDNYVTFEELNDRHYIANGAPEDPNKQYVTLEDLAAILNHIKENNSTNVTAEYLLNISRIISGS
jgi:hypothetical protein